MITGKRPSRRRVSLYGVASSALLFGELSGLGIDFTCDDGLGSVTVRGHSTNYNNIPVDSFLTNTTTSPKMVMKLDGTLGWTPHNQVLQSQTFATTWQKTVAGDSLTNTTFIAAASSGFHQFYQSGITIIAGATYSFDIEVKANGYNYAYIDIGWSGGADNSALFNLTDGTYSGYYSGGSGVALTDYSITPTSDGYYRIHGSFTPTSATSFTVAVGVRSTGGNFTAAFTGDGTSGILIRNAQLNRGAVPTRYLATTTAARYSVPIEYDLVLRQYYGLVEPAATNISLYSTAFDNAYWVKDTGVTVTADAVTSPDGLTTADKLLEGTSSGSHAVSTAAVSLNTATLSVFVKAGERTRIGLGLPGGVNKGKIFDLGDLSMSNFSTHFSAADSASITAFPNGWYRIAIYNSNASVTRGDIYVMDSGTDRSYQGIAATGLYIWQAQLETGAVATSPIPTFAATVTRAKDLIKVATSNFPVGAEYSTLIDATLNAVVDASGIVEMYDDAVTNYLAAIFISGANIKLYSSASGGVQSNFNLSSVPSTGARFKMAARWKTNDFHGARDGTLSGSPDTSGNVPSSLATLYLGYDVGGAVTGNMRIWKLVVLPRAYSDAELQAKTRG